MRFSVLGFISDIRIEIQAPVIEVNNIKVPKRAPDTQSQDFRSLLTWFYLVKIIIGNPQA